MTGVNTAISLDFISGASGTDYITILSNGFSILPPNSVRYNGPTGRFFMIHTSAAYFNATLGVIFSIQLNRNSSPISQARYALNFGSPFDCQDFNVLRLNNNDTLSWSYSANVGGGIFQQFSAPGLTGSSTKPFQIIIWEILVPP